MTCDVSVVVPAHNRATALAACLATLTAQDFARSRWELLIVDDGSADDTASRAERHADRLSLTVLRTAERRGPGPARNLALRVARGVIVLFLDSDTLAPPWLVRVHAAAHERRAVFVDGPAITLGTESPPAAPPFDALWVRALASLDRGGRPFVTANVSCRRVDIEAVGGFDERFGHRYGWEDTDLGLRLAAHGVGRAKSRHAYVLHWRSRRPDWQARGRKQAEAGWNGAQLLAKHGTRWVRREVVPRYRLARLLGSCGVDTRRVGDWCVRAAQRGGPSEWLTQVYELVRYGDGFDRAIEAGVVPTFRGSAR